jgi:hypothetical protein
VVLHPTPASLDQTNVGARHAALRLPGDGCFDFDGELRSGLGASCWPPWLPTAAPW